MPVQVRVARPVSDLARSVDMYKRGLGLAVLGTFADHEGFDGAMLGTPGERFHFEFTFCRTHPVRPTPTAEDLLVFYVPEATDVAERCGQLLAAGFVEVEAFNPYWRRRGRTFEDLDGYRLVVHHGPWRDAAA